MFSVCVTSTCLVYEVSFSQVSLTQSFYFLYSPWRMTFTGQSMGLVEVFLKLWPPHFLQAEVRLGLRLSPSFWRSHTPWGGVATLDKTKLREVHIGAKIWCTDYRVTTLPFSRTQTLMTYIIIITHPYTSVLPTLVGNNHHSAWINHLWDELTTSQMN